MGDKYGPFVVPNVIPVDEFHAFYAHTKEFRDTEMAIITAQLDEIEAAKAEREKGRVDAEVSDETAKKNKRRETHESQVESLKAVRRNADAIKAETNLIKNLQEQEKSLIDPEILKEWYLLDENVTPQVYRLQNIR